MMLGLRLLASIRSVSTCASLRSNKLTQKEYAKKTELKKLRDIEETSRILFQEAKAKDKETFKGALELFKSRDVKRRGAVEFIYAAMKNMEAFGVEKDLEVYKALVDVMPKGVFIPQNIIQSGFFHYPRQQEVLVDVLHKMSENKVSPDKELGDLIQTITGLDSAPFK